MPAQALVVRVYNATDHKRFDPFPTNPQINTSSIFSGVDLTGVGFRSSAYPTVQCALISRQHVMFATHYRSQLNNATIRFLNASNEVTDRATASMTIIQEGGVDCDLVVFQLASPIDADTGISPLPYYDGLLQLGVSVGVLGRDNTSATASEKFPVMGTGTIADLSSTPLDLYGDGSIVSRVYRFDYSTSRSPVGKTDNDCYLESGDSGSPSFVKVGGRAALMGVHTAVGQTLSSNTNFDTHVPYYVPQLDAVLNPMGYRMAPVGAAPTTLATTTSTTQSTPRKAMPLDYVYQVENTGAELTGNVEVEFQFDPAEAPASISGPAGWVTYGSGSKWTLRKATLDAAGLTSVTAHWMEAPSVNTLSFTVTRRSGTTADDVTAVDLSLAESYADWAAGLLDDGLTSDPDGDNVVNLFEYAFGGDPSLSSRVVADGSPLIGSIEENAGTVTFSYPEREDLVARGLSYTLEFSNDLTGWLDPPPPGFSSSTAEFDPPIVGFLKRSCTWPSGGAGPLFLRLDVELSE